MSFVLRCALAFALLLGSAFQPTAAFAVVPSSLNWLQFTLSNNPQVLPVTFVFKDATDLIVYDARDGEDPVVLTLNSDYSVIGGAGSTGTVTTIAGGAHAVQVGDVITISRNVPITQTTTFSPSGPLTASMVGNAFDKATQISQQINTRTFSSLRFQPNETFDGTLSLDARKGKYLAFDADTGAIAYLDGTGGGSGGTYTAGAGLQLMSNVFSVLPNQSFTSLTVTDPIVGSITGNAATAAALQTARLINGVSFDGTANITVPAAAGTLTGTTLAANVVNSSLNSVAAGTLGSMAIQNSNAVSITGGTINGAAVTGLANAVNPSDAVNLLQLQGVSSGITLRTGVFASTLANITLSGEQTIDGSSVLAGARVLVKNQSLSAENGIYTASAGAWSRSTDSNTAAELLVGYTYFVSSGTVNGASTWSINVAPTVLDTDPVGFVQFAASQSYVASTGLDLAGNAFSIKAAQTGLAITGSTFNGTVGATTPSTVAATSVSSGTVTSTGNIATTGNVLLKTNPDAQSYVFQTAAGVTRWGWYPSGAEAGANSGSDYILVSANDAGSQLGTTLKVTRSTGAVSMPFGGGLSVTGNTTSNIFTRTGTSTVASVWGVVSDATTYNMLTLNNVASRAGMVGLSGGGGSDTSLYLRAPTGGGFNFLVNNTTVATMPSTGLSVTGGVQETGVFNVRYYGALGNGSANDTTPIANAIAAAKVYHGSVYFPPGTYMTDLITITGATGLTIYGDGMGVSKIKARSPSRVINIESSSHINVRGLTFDGSCTVRTAGQQAVIFDTSDTIDFSHNEIINSGEFAIMVGNTSASNVLVANNLIGANYADGINIQNATEYIVSNNRITGADDDGIAVNGSNGLVIGNYVTHRSDSLTSTGRGIWSGFNATDILIIGNTVDSVKQTGIFINQEDTNKQARIKVIGNSVMNSPLISGQPIAIIGTQDCAIEDNSVYDPPIAVAGLIEIANWDNLKITGNKLYQRTDSVFVRGIHVDEGTGYSDTTWSDLTLKDNEIYFTGSTTSNGIYLQPNAANTMDTVIIDSNTVKQRSGVGNYIQLSGATTTMGKIFNNSTMTAGETISPSTGGVFTVSNNY